MNPLPLANKNLGQHFLHDTHVIEKITHPIPSGTDAIVEVGPGRGALTHHLSAHPLPLHLVEKDRRFAPLLAPFTPTERLHFQDALETDWDRLLRPYRRVWLVSNLPYNAGAPLLLQFLRCPTIAAMTLMFQREVADKILSPPMNSLMALVQTYSSCRRLLRVPPGAFSPPPQVHSTVIALTRLQRPPLPLQEFDPYENFLRRLFSHRRKQVQNVLRRMAAAEKVDGILEKLEINPSLRAESFNLGQIQVLYKEMSAKGVSSRRLTATDLDGGAGAPSDGHPKECRSRRTRLREVCVRQGVAD